MWAWLVREVLDGEEHCGLAMARMGRELEVVKTGGGQAELDLGGQSPEWNRGGSWMGKLSLLLGWGGKD